MLQNPSKYHSNPLSHFLALHNSQVAHNAHNSLPTGAVATGNSNSNSGNGGNGGSSNNHSQFHQHHPAIIMANHHHLHSSSQHHHHHHNHHHNSHHHHQHLNSATRSHAHLIDAANTSLDVGKSFTIAAILGLQKSAIGNNHTEYNNVINLSLNGGGNNSSSTSSSSSNNSNHANLNVVDDDTDKNCENNTNNTTNNNNNSHNNNNNNTNNNSSSSNSCKTNMSNNFNSSVNNFNCDSSNNLATINNAALVVNRYLPTANVNSAAAAAAAAAAVATSFAATAVAASHQQHQQQQQQQNLVLSHVRAVATAAAAANVVGGGGGGGVGVGGAPSALQSLQQLHQHHAQQQASLSFQREKHKTDNNTKKSSLKNKRVRTIFTPEQLERLEAEFERQQYMVGPERLYLAHTLQLTEAQVKVWFQNRRIKWRKHHLEITQQRLALLRQSQLPPATASAASVGVSTGVAAVGAVTGMNASSPRSCEDLDELKHNNEEIRHLSVSRQASESDLSICNDSMDAESIIDGGEDT